MKFYFTLFCSLAFLTFSNAQNSILEFDGVDDYIDLGEEVGNGLRTIEMWFNLEEGIDNQLDDFSTLAAREISGIDHTNEFTLSFQPSFVANAGTLRFDVHGTEPFRSVYSNNISWNANQWYHVAAVIHPVDGMMLFINGIKQTSTHPHTGDTGNSSKISTIGCWGDLNVRFFKGKIDNVRFSSEALYTTDFNPLCEDLEPQTNDLGLWNFNENQGVIAVDSSPNSNDGDLEGANWDIASICNNVVSFDGVDDYIDLGGEVGNGLRTIEMWFNLEEDIDTQLDDFSTLAAREISGIDHTNEFTLSFQPSFVANAGTLRFDIHGTQPFRSVYSNNTSWNANQWYHVAAVIHPVDGMMLFIDGIKQTSTHPHTGAAGNSSKISTLGCWGDLNIRFFKGKIDNVRFSSEPLYTTDFVPSCEDLPSQTNDLGLWHFNEYMETIAVDSSANSHDGQLVGATKYDSEICSELISVNTKDLVNTIPLKVYPNPSSDIFYFKHEQSSNLDLQIIVYNSVGQVILNQKVRDTSFEINLQDKVNGIYFYQLNDGKVILNSGKLKKVK